jgi:hypothetical protein
MRVLYELTGTADTSYTLLARSRIHLPLAGVTAADPGQFGG